MKVIFKILGRLLGGFRIIILFEHLTILLSFPSYDIFSPFYYFLLQAALYQTDFRPIPLEEYIKVGNTIYDKKMEVVRTISRAADIGGKDPDHIVQLCNEVCS